jgi:hypothetical protein
MMREASSPVEAYSAIKSWRASSVVGASNTNGMDALLILWNRKNQKGKHRTLCEFEILHWEEMLKPWRHEGVGS